MLGWAQGAVSWIRGEGGFPSPVVPFPGGLRFVSGYGVEFASLGGPVPVRFGFVAANNPSTVREDLLFPLRYRSRFTSPSASWTSPFSEPVTASSPDIALKLVAVSKSTE